MEQETRNNHKKIRSVKKDLTERTFLFLSFQSEGVGQ